MPLPDTIPEAISHILAVLAQNGHQAYLVGGCVRDSLLGKCPNDWDLCTSALPEQTQSLFDKTVPTGLRHGTVTVLYGGETAEVTTFRCDGDYTDHRRPDTVRFGRHLEEDLARRDFTINAMAMDREGTLYDLFGGRSDLRNKVVRCVGDPDRRFREDALRMFRCLRFAAQLDFTVHPETWAAIRPNAGLCRFLAAERVCEEVGKTLLSPRPERLDNMVRLGLLDGFLIARNPMDLGALSKLPADSYLRWARFALALYAAGNLSEPEQFFRHLRLDGHTIQVCSKGIALARNGFPDTPSGVKRFLSHYGVEAVRCAAACGAVPADLDLTESVLNSGECYDLKHLAVGGGDLTARGLSGPEVGKTLERLLDRVIEHPEQNQRETLLRSLEGEEHDYG